MLDSFYHMTLKFLFSYIFGVKKLKMVQISNHMRKKHFYTFRLHYVRHECFDQTWHAQKQTDKKTALSSQVYCLDIK